MPVSRPSLPKPAPMTCPPRGACWGRIILLPVFCLLLWSAPASGARIKVEGVSGELEDNVEVFLAAVPDPADGGLERHREQLQKGAREALQALGYYEPTVTVTLDPQRKDGSATVRIVSGMPVRVATFDVQVQGEGNSDPEFKKWIDRAPLKIGDPFHHGKYDQFKSGFSDLAVDRGYFDAEWQAAKVEVSIAEKSARISLVFDTHQRYRIGAVSISGAPEHEELIWAVQPFDNGQPYLAALLAEYNADLNDTGFFRSILVRPDLDNRADGLVPVIVQAIPYADNIVSIGAGISTDIGPRGSLKWTIPHLNRYGHSFSAATEVSGPEQQVIASYKVPLEDAHENFALLQTGFQHKDNGDTNSHKYTVQARRNRKLDNLWERAYFISFEFEDFIQGLQSEITRTVLPGVSFTRERARGGLNVHWGDRLQLYLEASHPAWGSDSRLLKMRGRTKWVRTSGEEYRHKFIARADLGAIAVASIFDVPASLRFFTGGDQTIRGFSYESVAPRDAAGFLIGGKYLAVGSLEYGYLVFEKWRVAAFVDAGTATNDFSEPLSVGSGVGIRWITPVGPLRLDLAYALSEPGTPWMVHFSMGPDI